MFEANSMVACLHVGSLYVLIRKACVCVCVFKTEHTYKHVCMLETYMSLSKKHVFVFVCLKQGTHVFVFVCLNQGTCTHVLECLHAMMSQVVWESTTSTTRRQLM